MLVSDSTASNYDPLAVVDDSGHVNTLDVQIHLLQTMIQQLMLMMVHAYNPACAAPAPYHQSVSLTVLFQLDTVCQISTIQ